MKSRAPSLFVNARTDTFWLGDGDLEGDAGPRGAPTSPRARTASSSPGVTEPATIEMLARDMEAPLNVLFSHTLPAARRAWRRARVSTGSALFRVALGAAVDAARAIRDGGESPPASRPTSEISGSGRTRTVDREHELAAHVAALEALHRVGRALQRERRLDVRAQLPSATSA